MRFNFNKRDAERSADERCGGAGNSRSRLLKKFHQKKFTKPGIFARDRESPLDSMAADPVAYKAA
jgi:hypothetical protein